MNRRELEGMKWVTRSVRRTTTRRIVALLSAIVFIFTSNHLIIKADTLERVPSCGLDEHVHGDECRVDGELTCVFTEHVHTDACYQQRPTRDDAEEEEVAAEAVELEAQALETFELTEDDAEPAEDIVSAPELVIYDEPAPTPEYGVELNGRGAISLEELLRESGLPLSIEAVDWIAPLEAYAACVGFDGADGALEAIVLEPFETAELAIASGEALWTVTLRNGKPAEAMSDEMAADDRQVPVEALAVDTPEVQLELVADDSEAPAEEAFEVDDDSEAPVEEAFEVVADDSEAPAEEAFEVDDDSEAPAEEAFEVVVDDNEAPAEEAFEVVADEEPAAEASAEEADDAVTDGNDENDAPDIENNEETPADAVLFEVNDAGESTDSAADVVEDADATDESTDSVADVVEDADAIDESANNTADAVEETDAIDESTENTADAVEDADATNESTDSTADAVEDADAIDESTDGAADAVEEADAIDESADSATDAVEETDAIDESTDSTEEKSEFAADDAEMAQENAEDVGTDEETSKDAANEESVETPARFELTVDLSGIAESLSLRRLMANAEAASIAAPEPETEVILEEADDPDEWIIEYDAALLMIERADDDVLISPVADFDATVVEVHSHYDYALTLVGGVAAEAAEPAPAFPAQTFEVSTDVLQVSVSAPEGAFPEGTTMTVTDVDDAATLDSIAGTVGNDATAVKAVHAVDITFRSAEGVELEPLLPISVHMAALERPEVEQTPVVVHVTDDGAASLVAQDAADVDGVAFTADAFSIYAMVLTETLETCVIADEGETYRVTATYGPEAGIPAGATLTARLMSMDDADYAARIDEAVRFLSDENWLAAVLDAQMFDIAITVDGAPIEPLAPVQVRIEYVDPMPFSGDAEPVLVHFADSGIETLDVTTDICEDEYSVVDFETASFSTFAFAEVNYIGALDGVSFAIVRNMPSNEQIALTSTPRNTPAGRLQGVWVNELEEGALTAVTAAKGTVPAEEKHITAWTFEHIRDNLYNVKSDDGKYLSITANAVAVTDTPTPIEVIPTETGKKYNGNVYLRSTTDTNACLNYKVENSAPGFKSSVYSEYYADSRLSLYRAAESEPAPRSDARKIASTDIRSAEQVVIYQRMYNEALDTYDNYVLTGDGKLVYAYDEGDYVSYRSDAGTTWYVIEHVDDCGEPTGYFDFFNTVTHKYLAPSSSGILSDEPVGVLLSGRVDGNYSTAIESWDASRWSYYGYALDPVNRVYEPAVGDASGLFSFARIVDFQAGELHPVETVDSAAKGIRIAMYDFKDRATMNVFNDNTGNVGFPPNKLLVQRVLGADGMPVSKTGTSFSTLYNAANYKGEANHLFLQSVYDATGYYEFSSYNNGAEYDAATGNFNVYEELITPNGQNTENKTTYLRGNFLPFNTLDIDRPAILTRQYQSATDWMDLDDPAFDQKLYESKEKKVDYQFGTVIDADFLQAKSGLDDRGDPVVYEFSGDDDLWVFLDGVLVLDIGGIHSAIDGSINFHTGVVKVYDGGKTYTTTTIRQCFKEAGVFPDGTPWNEAIADAYFTGDTFTNYSGHSMKMIYQERGAGASTLKVRFNLPVVEKGSFAVEKQLLGTRQQKYSDVQFAYQAFLDPDDGDDIPLYPGLLLDIDGHVVERDAAEEEILANAVRVTYEDDGREALFHDGEIINGNSYDHVFYLRPDEAVSFTGIPEGVRYYVQEIDVSGAYYETVMINEANMQGEEGIGEDASITARSSSKTIQERQRVIFENKCSDKNIRDLRITKQVLNPNPNGDPGFEFRVLLEGPGGALVPYARGEYYLLDPEGHCCRFEGGAIVPTAVIYPESEDIQNYTYGISGPNGTIANVPDGCTVVIAGLLADTHFRVEEVNLPEGFAMEGKQFDDCGAATVDGADGRIVLGKDAKVTVQNKHYSTIRVDKVWNTGNYPVERHGDIRMGLYHDGALVEGSIRTISAPATSETWYIDLTAGETLADYTVYEVTGSGDAVRPLKDTGAALSVTGERVTGYGDDITTTYVFTDRLVGSETTVADAERLNIRTRTDTITNAMPSLNLKKTTVDGSSLAGARFQLTDEQGRVIFDALESGSDGLIISDLRLPDGVYWLRETQAPMGYQPLENQLRLTVGGEIVIDLMADVATGGTRYADKDDDPLAWQFDIVNTGGYQLPSTGGVGTGLYTAIGLALIGFALAMLLRKRIC